jgi:hypothetical protein
MNETMKDEEIGCEYNLQPGMLRSLTRNTEGYAFGMQINLLSGDEIEEQLEDLPGDKIAEVRYLKLRSVC